MYSRGVLLARISCYLALKIGERKFTGVHRSSPVLAGGTRAESQDMGFWECRGLLLQKKTNRIIVFWSFLLILKRFQCILLILLSLLQFSRFERICSIKRFEHLMHPEPKYKFLRVIDLCLCWI